MKISSHSLFGSEYKLQFSLSTFNWVATVKKTIVCIPSASMHCQSRDTLNVVEGIAFSTVGGGGGAKAAS